MIRQPRLRLKEAVTTKECIVFLAEVYVGFCVVQKGPILAETAASEKTSQ